MKVKLIVLILILTTFSIVAQEKDSKPIETVSLPETPNSWIINIHQRGGFMGVHRLLLTINSDGKYACGENGKTQTITKNDRSFSELSELIKPIQNDIILKTINEAFESCNDCLYSTFSFRRNKEKVNDGEIVEVSAKQPNVPTAKEVSEKVWKTVKCD